MAGSRLENFGTVFTRVRDLMRAGVIKQRDRPVWFDVFAAFPPKTQPKREGPRRTDPVPDVIYREDETRAKFFQVYGNGPRAFDLLRPGFTSPCQRFVMKMAELESRGDVKQELLFEETAKALLTEGLHLRKRGGTSEPRDPLLDMKLKDMLAEQQRHTEEEAQAEAMTDTAGKSRE